MSSEATPKCMKLFGLNLHFRSKAMTKLIIIASSRTICSFNWTYFMQRIHHRVKQRSKRCNAERHHVTSQSE